MADSTNSPLHAQLSITIDSQEVIVSIFADSAQELLDSINVLLGKPGAHTSAPGPEKTSAPSPGPHGVQAAEAAQPAPTPAAAQQTQAPSQPTPTAQPGPSAAATAPAPAATPSATTTAAQPSQPELTLNDVLAPARQLLQSPNGEDTLRQILGQFGAQAISQADPQHYAGIKQAIEQSIPGQA